MYLLDLQDRVLHSSNLEELLEDISQLSSVVYDQMTPEETFWVYAPSADKAHHWPVGLAAGDSITDNTGLVLKNVISRYHGSRDSGENEIANAYEEILFLVRNKREYHFNKDAIRVAHVYQGNEWNERSEGKSSYHDYSVRRYNPKGKDPGNVWLGEIRTDTTDETVDRIEPFPRAEAITRSVLAGSKEGEEVVAIDSSPEVDSVIKKTDRRLNRQDSDEFLEE